MLLSHSDHVFYFLSTDAPAQTHARKSSSGATAAATTATTEESPASDKCLACGKTAFVTERVSVEGKLYHASCFKVCFSSSSKSACSFFG